MTLNQMASLIAKREGKKSQARIGDIREILGILADISYEDGSTAFWFELYDSGIRRAIKRKKSESKGKRK